MKFFFEKDKKLWTLDEVKREWSQGLFMGAFISFIVFYIWFRYIE